MGSGSGRRPRSKSPRGADGNGTMNEIHGVVGRAGRRLLAADFLRRLVVTTTVVLCAAFLARVAQKLVPFGLDWGVALGAGAGAALLGAAIWSLLRRRGSIDVAREVDERAGLRESLSTALCVERSDDAWSTNVVETARASARRVVLQDAIPIAAPARWPVPIAVVLALLAVWWVPQYDVTGMFSEREAAQARETELKKVLAEVDDAERRIETLAEKAGLKMAEDDETVEAGDELDPNAPITPEEVQRVALKKLTKLADDLESLTESEKGAELQAMKDAMRRLNDPGLGPASEMAREMAKGNFDQAKSELESLMEQVASGDMSDAQKQEAAEQLNQLKKQVEEMARQQNELTEQLQAAGYSAEEAQKMASSADEMERKLSENQSLDEGQKQQLQQAAQAQRQASDSMSAMAQAMGQMAQGMQSQNMGEASEGMESLAGQLGDLSMMQADMAAAEAALGECQSQMAALGESLCQGSGNGQGQAFGQGVGQNSLWSAGPSSQMGSGSGSAGQGNGSGPNEQATDFVTKREKSNVNTSDGPVIASTLVFGQQVRGESKVTFGEAVSAGRADAAEAIETKAVPREYENAVQHYFGRLERLSTDEDAGDEG